jgi:hypothetical protein
MSDTYRIYQYDYAGYYHGVYQDIPVNQGYPAGPWTDVSVPSIPDGQFAVFDGTGWFLTSEEEPLPPPPPPEPVEDIVTGPEASGPTPTVI